MKIAILGGGIAGLSAAIALQKTGLQVQVFEAAPHFKPVGAGLLLAANAVKAYQKMGIAGDIIRHGRLLPAFEVREGNGNRISYVDSASISRQYGLHNFAIHRADLHRALLGHLDAACLHTDKRAIGVEDTADGVRVLFQDGTDYQADFVVAADGIHSPIRQQLLPGSTPRYAGYTCWRAVVNGTGIGQEHGSETWAPGARFGIVPLPGDRYYWFACLNAVQNDPVKRAYTMADLKLIFGRFHDPVPDLLHQTPESALIWSDIIDLKPTGRYHFGRVLLIGDAAHATTPNMGQGACQAIEDAVVLADEWTKFGDMQAAFRAFEARRMARTRGIVNTSWTLGRIAQLENPVLIALRNWAFRMTPERVNERQMASVLNVDFED
jgi:2-polyprenyl-6-methoxyphenol hydroxylase-like FAD-dependent oxidoreductase